MNDVKKKKDEHECIACTGTHNAALFSLIFYVEEYTRKFRQFRLFYFTVFEFVSCLDDNIQAKE